MVRSALSTSVVTSQMRTVLVLLMMKEMEKVVHKAVLARLGQVRDVGPATMKNTSK